LCSKGFSVIITATDTERDMTDSFEFKQSQQPSAEQIVAGGEAFDDALRLLNVEMDDSWTSEQAQDHALLIFNAMLERKPDQPFGCHIDLSPGEKPDACVLDTGKHADCFYAKRFGQAAREKCGEWKPISFAENVSNEGGDKEPDALHLAAVDLARKQAARIAELEARLASLQNPSVLNPREIELIDGMIQVQLHHAEVCDGMANRAMADKQKGWDMERVALLQKFKTGAALPAVLDVSFLRQTVGVAIAGLFEHYQKDVEQAFDMKTLEDVVEDTFALAGHRVEDIYKKAWDMLTTAISQELEPEQFLLEAECTKCGAKESGVLSFKTSPVQGLDQGRAK